MNLKYETKINRIMSKGIIGSLWIDYKLIEIDYIRSVQESYCLSFHDIRFSTNINRSLSLV